MEEKKALSGVVLQIQDLIQTLTESLNEAMLRLERISKELEDTADKKIKGPEYVV